MKATTSLTCWLGVALACGTLAFALTTQAAKPPKPPPTPTGPAYVIVPLGGLLDSDGRLVNSLADINNAGQVVGNTAIPGTTGQQACLIDPLDADGNLRP